METRFLFERSFYNEKSFTMVKADNSAFYHKLEELKNSAEMTDSCWKGGYIVSTYFLPTGEVWEYWDDMDSGIPYQIVKIR